jgi:hypothetical protein
MPARTKAEMDALLANADRIIQEARFISDAARKMAASRAAGSFVGFQRRHRASDRRIDSRGGRRGADGLTNRRLYA